MSNSSVMTLITDFGTGSPYSGMIKGVATAINPDIRIIDITNDIKRHSVMEAAITLAMSYRYFPKGTVHVVVVDPGVGTARRAIGAKAHNMFFIAPDNGVLSVAIAKGHNTECVEITNPEVMLKPTSATFHGRDVFAPAAAHLTLGLPLEQLGERVENFMQLALPAPEIKRDQQQIVGHVIYLDAFGNAITNITSKSLRYCFEDSIPPLEAVAGRAITVFPFHKTYDNVSPGRPLSYFGSSAYMELAVNRGHAAQDFLLEIGSLVTIRPQQGNSE